MTDLARVRGARSISPSCRRTPRRKDYGRRAHMDLNQRYSLNRHTEADKHKRLYCMRCKLLLVDPNQCYRRWDRVTSIDAHQEKSHKKRTKVQSLPSAEVSGYYKAS
ncbi:hypothetical protein BHE74_00029012 [Ensete ventricosum]|nr:hypothetical protein BHE74_00029012 [Ensete ventricosum]